MPAIAPVWLTVLQAADRLNVHPNTVRRMIDAGRLPASRIRGTRVIRVRATDADALLRPVAAAGQ